MAEPSRTLPRACPFATGLAVVVAAAAQSPQELARQAGEAMQRQEYAAAESAYRRLIPQAPKMAELHSNLGLACFMQKKIPCTVEALRTALRLNRDLFLPNYLLGQIQFQQGRYAEARGLVERALELQPRQPEARQLLIATLVGLKEYERAIDEWGSVLAENPRDADARYGLGGVYMQMSQGVTDRLLEHEDSGYTLLVAAERDADDPQWLAFVLATYRDAFARDIRLPGARIPYARLQLSRQEWAGARSTLEEELDLDPYSYEARFFLAQTALGEGDAALSVRLLDEAVGIRPEFFRPLPELSPALDGVDPAALRAVRDKGDESFGAAFLLARLEQVHQSRAGTRLPLAELRRDRQFASVRSQAAGRRTEDAGLELLRKKRYEAGLAILMPLVREGKLERRHIQAVAGALARVGRDEEVIRLFRGAAPQSPEELYQLATSYKQAALAQFERMAELDPDSARAHQVLGDSYLAQQRLDQALAEYERAVELAPANSELRYQVGSVLHRKMEYGRSAEVFSEVVELDPLNAEAHVLRGEALARLGRNDEAVRAMERGVALKPQSAAAHAALGRAYRAAGDNDEALRHLSKGAASDPDGSVHYQLFLLYRDLDRPDEARAALATSQRLRARGR